MVQQGLEFGRGHGRGEQEALVGVDAEAGEQVGLGGGFHAFGDAVVSHSAGHVGDGADDGEVAGVVIDAGGEAPVEFKDVGRVAR